MLAWGLPSSRAQNAALNLGVFKAGSWGAHLRPVLALAVSADGLIATGSVDETGKLWAGVSGKLQKTIGAHADSVTAVAFSPDGGLLFTGSDDQSVRVLETGSASEQQVLRTQGRVRSLAASGGLLAVGTDNGRIQVFQLRQGGAEAVAQLQGHSGEVRGLAFRPGSGVLLSGSRDGTVRLWDAAKGTSLASKSEGVPVSGVAFDPAGQRLAYGLENGLVYLHPANAFSQNSAVRASGGVQALAFAPGGAYVG
ncbi:WD40 repeat domain-containing protein, partial [Calidithermus terrae]|uniref:WD40 repeat domain-containing protein n=1 Tax=Calidithermus terrae TaxID=1408545 RepID=UPI003B84B335